MIIPSMKTFSKIVFTIIPKVTIISASENFALCSPTIALPENQRDGAVMIIPEMSSTKIWRKFIDTVQCTIFNKGFTVLGARSTMVLF